MSTKTSTRKAVITGGSSGIGKSIAKKFSGAGYETAIADITPPDETTSRFYPVDLTHPESIEEFIDQVKETLGNPDILVCNAGRGVHEKLTEGNPDTWENIFRLNVFSAFRLIRAFVPDMLHQKSGDVVFISSVSAHHAHTYGGIYTASKAAIDQIAETLRLEVLPDVRVSVVRPGVVDTQFFKNMISGDQTPESIGWGALKADQVADSVFHAVTQPKGVMLNDIVIRPVAQPM